MADLLSSKRRTAVLVTLCLAVFTINLDTTIVNVALPTLVRELGASTTQLQWVVDAYNLVFAALVLAAGSVSDRVGRKGALLEDLRKARWYVDREIQRLERGAAHEG